jgi:hypothetical protein
MSEEAYRADANRQPFGDFTKAAMGEIWTRRYDTKMMKDPSLNGCIAVIVKHGAVKYDGGDMIPHNGYVAVLINENNSRIIEEDPGARKKYANEELDDLKSIKEAKNKDIALGERKPAKERGGAVCPHPNPCNVAWF